MKGNNFKLVFIGDSCAGKTSICRRFLFNNFDEIVPITIGASYTSKLIDDIKLNIWDTAGQERFAPLLPLYYRDADIVLLVFDIVNINYKSMKLYFNEVINNNKDCSIYIIGNKTDKVNENYINNINLELTQQFKNELNIKIFFVSAKTNFNIDVLLNDIVETSKKRLDIKHTLDELNINDDNSLLNKDIKKNCSC